MIVRATTSPTNRPGVTFAESALVFLVFLAFVLGMFDLGMAVFQNHILTDTACYVARQASVHGAGAAVLGPWGPATVGPVSATDSSPACVAASNYLTGFDPAAVTVLVEWPDGGNTVGMRVRVTLTTNHTLLFPQFCGGNSLPLQAVATTIVLH